MAGQVVQMDYPVVQAWREGFRQQADIMLGSWEGRGGASSQVLEMASFMVPADGAYYGRCKDATKKKSKELVRDVEGVRRRHLTTPLRTTRMAIPSGKRYFGKG